MSVFNNDYAAGYDALYKEKNYQAECDVIEAVLGASSTGRPIRLLDVGCGTGGHAIELARRGHQVCGVDLSAAMLTVAQRKAEEQLPRDRRPAFVQGDARDFAIEVGGVFDAAVMMFAVVGYLTDNASVISALTNVRRHLKTGALFMCDFWWGPAVLMQRPGERVRLVRTAEGQLLRATRTVLDTQANTADVHFDVFDLSDNKPARHSEETHRMRYYFAPELELLFNAAGMKLQRIGRFPQTELAPTPECWDAVAIAEAV